MSKEKTESKKYAKKELEEELQKAKDSKIQIMADFDNFRKRTEAEKAKFGAMANRSLIEGLMEVVDDISLASKDDEMTIERAQEMMQLLSEKLTSMIEHYDIARIVVNKGDSFDPTIMEAITVVPVPEDQDGTVIEIISSGYKYKNTDELIRNAKVIVGKKD